MLSSARETRDYYKTREFIPFPVTFPSCRASASTRSFPMLRDPPLIYWTRCLCSIRIIGIYFILLNIHLFSYIYDACFNSLDFRKSMLYGNFEFREIGIKKCLFAPEFVHPSLVHFSLDPWVQPETYFTSPFIDAEFWGVNMEIYSFHLTSVRYISVMSRLYIPRLLSIIPFKYSESRDTPSYVSSLPLTALFWESAWSSRIPLIGESACESERVSLLTSYFLQNFGRRCHLARVHPGVLRGGGGTGGWYVLKIFTPFIFRLF